MSSLTHGRKAFSNWYECLVKCLWAFFKKGRGLQLLPFESQLNTELVAFIILNLWIDLFTPSFFPPYSIKVHMLSLALQNIFTAIQPDTKAERICWYEIVSIVWRFLLKRCLLTQPNVLI